MVCPSQESLQAFLEGRLTDPNMGALADHLGDCEPCVQTLTALTVHDSLLGMVHSLKSSNALSEKSPEVETLVAHVCSSLFEAHSTPGLYETPTDATAAAAVRPSIPGYEILGYMDRGGMGVVYKARHLALDKVMALKLCSREKVSPSLLAQFRQEMQAVGQLNHAHIVQAHDAGVTNGIPYLAMEYLEGIDLESLVEQKGSLPVADACEYIRQAALGLAHADSQNMVHRDLKPANLLLTSGGVVKILDLGLARLREAAPSPDDQHAANEAPATTTAVGTPEYMAPEQWHDAHTVDIRADLYSLGCTLYHLLAGKPPFEGKTLEQRTAHLKKTPMPLRQLRPDVPAKLSHFVDQLLAKDAARRPAKPADVVAALGPFTAKAVRSAFWSKLWVRIAGLFAFALIAGSIIYVVTDRGTVVIETDDADIEVAVKQNGRLIRILDRKSGKEFTLPSGIYELELQPGQNGLRLKTDRLILYRGDRKIVEVIPPGGWIQRKPIPVPATAFMAGVVNERIYVIGGEAGGSSVPAVQEYDPKTDDWTADKTHLPKTDEGDPGRYGGAVAVSKGKLYVIGGWRIFGRLPTDTIHIYDPTKDPKGGNNTAAWTRGPTIPILSGNSVAGIFGGKLYLLTGTDGNSGYHKHFHVCNLATSKWTRLKSPPHAHAGGAGGIIDGKFYIAAGYHSDALPSPHLDVYDFATDQWTTKRSMSIARTDVAGLAHDGRLYMVGGTDAKRTTLDVVEVYDPATDTWTALPRLTVPRQSLAVAAIGRTLFAIGGSDGKSLFSSVEALGLHLAAKRRAP